MIESAALYIGLFISGVLLASFLGDLVYKITKIPSVIWLMLIGYALSHYFNVINPSEMREIEPIVGPLALAIVFFDAGLMLNIFEFFFKSIRPLIFSILVVAFIAFGVAIVSHAIFGWDYAVGAILGAIFCGTGTAVVVPLMKGLHLSKDVVHFLTVEGALTGVFAIILTATLTDFVIFGTVDINTAGIAIATSIGKGILIGTIVGVLWLLILYKTGKLEYPYMITLAIMFFVYIVSDYVSGNGPLSALFFGMVMGNSSKISEIIRLKHPPVDESTFIKFESEFMFFFKSFFFIYLGTLIIIVGDKIFIISGVLVLILLVTRIFATFISTLGSRELGGNRFVLSAFITRGLKTAVLATLPLTIVHGYMKTHAYLPQLYPLAYIFRQFPDIVFIVIGVSVLLSTFLIIFWSLIIGRRREQAKYSVAPKIIHEGELLE
ncbi:MAG: cation:proton antiporter [Candidatus Anstonellales archaeon]